MAEGVRSTTDDLGERVRTLQRLEARVDAALAALPKGEEAGEDELLAGLQRALDTLRDLRAEDAR